MSPHGRALAGRRVVVTRRPEDAGQLAAALAALGAQVVYAPCLSTTYLPAQTWQPAMAQLPRITCTAFASRVGVDALAWALNLGPWVLPQAAALWAVGPATQRRAQALWPQTVRLASPHTAEGLAQALLASLDPKQDHVLLPGAQAGRTVVREALQARGIAVTPLALYVTTSVAGRRQGLDKGCCDVLFTSPSGVAGWMRGGPHPADARCISIGPTTSQALRDAGLTVFAEAQTPSVAGLVAALLENLHDLRAP